MDVVNDSSKLFAVKAAKRQVLRLAGLWTAAVGLSAAWLISDQLDSHRADQLHVAEHRLKSLQDSLEVNFQQLSALPRALGRQDAITQFLSQIQIEWASTMPEAERPKFSQELSSRPDVRETSQMLRETANDFKVNQIYLLDPYGTIIANSAIETDFNTIGGNRRTRQYFTEAVELGSGTQFLVGKTNKQPGFFFSARVGNADEPAGVVVVRQDPQAMMRLFSDPQRQLFVTDAQGVVLMTNQPPDMLGRINVPGGLGVSDQTLASLYQSLPKALDWKLDTLHVEGQPTTLVTRHNKRFLALSTPLNYGHLTAWTLIPLDGETTLIAGWSAGLFLLLLSGYGVLGIWTQRVHRMQALSHAQQELTSMAHALPLTVFRYHQPAQGPGQFTFLGEGLSKLLGIQPHQLQDDPEWVWRMASQTPPLPPSHPVEFAVMRGGRPCWIRCESQVTEHADGSRTYNGYWADITENKLLTAQSEAVFHNAPLGFLYYDEALSVTRCNEAALRLFGAPNEAAMLGNKPHRPPMSPPMDEAQLAAMRQSFVGQLQRGEVAHFEWRYTRLDGTPFDADVVAIPFVIDGKSLECAIIQDITARKQTEAAARAAQQAAEAAAQAKSHFLANMSHEIRTPMNAVLGMTHLALMDELPDRARNYIDKAHRAASNLLQILNDVLDVSKIESGKLELEQTEFQLETVVSHMADVLGVKAEEKGLELLFTAPPDIPTALIGDPTRLGQILINLGNNAIKFTPKGEVVIGCEVQRLEPQEVILHFWVKDTGIGMNPEQMDRLFQPFAQGDSSTTRQYGGTGLGLTISRQLTDMMKGQIWVDSQPDHGSTFHFTARFGLQAQSANRRALLASELQGKRLMLVDDNPSAREILGDMARRMGLDVDVASGGAQALAIMQQAQQSARPHHILMTDWKMPGMDGIAFAKQALAMPPEHRPCVLLVTAFAREEAIKAAQGVGLAGIINKPVTPSTLLDTMAHALGQTLAPAPTPKHAGKIMQQAQRQLAGARVLLVEDQPMNQELACDLLERAGLTVVTALNGQEALDKLEHQGPFDGVLMDCQMPVMDGYTAARKIREHAPWEHLPIIAMTAGAMSTDRERVLESGMNDHITKPLDLAAMFNIMARWIVPARPALQDTPTPDAQALAMPVLSTLDTLDGLSRCMGNLDLYRRLVKGFAKTQRDFAAQFEAHRHDPEQTAHLTHTLKGLAGNIGAKALLSATHELEDALHQGTDASQPLQHVIEQLNLVLNDVARLTQAEESKGEQGHQLAKDQNLRPYWTRLAQLIADNDAQAGDLLQDALDTWPDLIQSPTVVQLKKALDLYDFDQAAVALSQL